MRDFRFVRTWLAATGASCLLLAASCSSGSSGGSGDNNIGFELTQISVPEGAVWQVNRPIELTFSQEVDFATVSLNTINITTVSGQPATGTFFFKAVDLDGDGSLESVNRKVVVFQPTCPRLGDLSDAGLQPGGVPYRLAVLGQDSGAGNVVRSESGGSLRTTQTRRFTTPSTNDPSVAFIDTVNGPPVPVVRLEGSNETAATYIELGDDPSNRVYFEFDDDNQTTDTNPAGFEVPLNLFSDESTSVAIVVEFNQPVSPDASNLSENLIRLEFLDSNLDWTPIDTSIVLTANCTETGGARVRLEPVGVLPASSRFRAIVQPGFEDIVGDPNLLDLDEFAQAPTLDTQFNSLTPPDDNADGVQEEFTRGGGAADSLEDEEALFPSTPADWSGGRLTAAFDFQGTGGNDNGDFDWVIGDDEELFVFDTTSTTITGGPGGAPTSTQTSVGGKVDVRDLIILEGAILRVQGPNPMILNATGKVEIRGTLDVSGFNAKNVATLNTGNQAEKGGAGAAGGGRGGNASEVTNDSTRRGGAGFGAFGLVDGGGEGGESGYFDGTGAENRRPGNGGGGAFGEYPGGGKQVAAEAGDPGASGTTGCVSGEMPAPGGSPGPDPFANQDLEDNVFGIRPITTGGMLDELKRGELSRIWAGAGGGGGGDALQAATCPSPNWTASSDEKGGGGGGGGGALRINALGPVIFGNAGQILVEGGQGATGENTNFLDHIGGSGGGGSGGHVLIETAAQIDFTDGQPATAPKRDYISALGGLGGQGEEPPIDSGGAGGAGVIQLHVPDPISVPSTDTGGSIVIPDPGMDPPLSAIAAPAAIAMIPTFGARSQARSKWISIGGADQDPGGGVDLVEFLFGGVETTDGLDEGKVLTTNGMVDELSPLLVEDLTGNPDASIDPDGVTLRLSGMALAPLINDTGNPSDDIFLRTPALLRQFNLRLSRKANPNEAFENFDVVAADYDDVNVVLTLTTSSSLGTLQDFVDAQGAQVVQYELIPRFFRVRTGTSDAGLDLLDENAFIRITFDAAAADASGDPDEDNLLVEGTGDISDFNALMPGELQFFRFNVEFDLDESDAGISTDTEPVALEFLKIPFKF